MKAIVRHAYRPRRARKRKPAAALNVPAIVRIVRRKLPPEPASVPLAADAVRQPIATAPRDGTPISARKARGRWARLRAAWRGGVILEVVITL